MEDLKEHIGTVITIIGVMWTLIVVLVGVVVSQLKSRLKNIDESICLKVNESDYVIRYKALEKQVELSISKLYSKIEDKLEIDLKQFPLWLVEMERQGGVVTHNELLEEGPLMTTKSHEIICSRICAQFASQIQISERHQKDLLELVEREFRAVSQGQDKMIARLVSLQDDVLRVIKNNTE